MRVTQLATLSKQMGNNIIEARDGRLYGYTITAYKGYTPVECELVGSIENPTGKVISFDTAYDILFGKPTAPDFTKVLA